MKDLPLLWMFQEESLYSLNRKFKKLEMRRYFHDTIFIWKFSLTQRNSKLCLYAEEHKYNERESLAKALVTRSLFFAYSRTNSNFDRYKATNRMFVNDKLRRTWKKIVMAYLTFYRPDNGGSKDLSNVCKILPYYTAQQPRR